MDARKAEVDALLMNECSNYLQTGFDQQRMAEIKQLYQKVVMT